MAQTFRGWKLEPLNQEQLALALQQLYRDADERLRNEFDRSLPFQDAVFDRWERSRRLGFAEGASIYNSAVIFGKVSVGEQSWIGPYCILDASGGPIEIGAYVSIASGVHVYTHDTVLWALSGGVLAKRQVGVKIGSNVYIGSQSVIAAGVTVGSRCVIGANSFVNDDVPDGTVVGGSPAKRIGVVIGEGAETRVVFDPKS